jgi:glycosyltransferase involved in cell wall biosynthesis
MSPGPIDRIRQTRRLLRSEGASGVAARVGDRVARRLSPPDRVELDVTREELMRAADVAASGWKLPPTLPHEPGEPLTIAWVSVATGGFGSGGHTTMLRHIEALEQAGHRCVLYFTDSHGWSIEQHRRMVHEWWPTLKADVRDAAYGIEDAHAIFATSWPTAYTVLASKARGKRFYLVMDYEPWFYPQSSNALLAEATYRFGFHGVTGGRWLAELLLRDFGMAADHFDFASDLDMYALDPHAERTGICYYARYSKPRRAFEIGMLALELFAQRHPEVDIHLYGDTIKRLPFRAVSHGHVQPAELNQLYNRCIAGLVLSATNVSLVPHEMLAAGCIPVVNDNEFGRIVLDNDDVVYAGSTPFELADALSRLVERPAAERQSAAEAAAASVDGRTWDEEGAAVERIVRSVVDGVAVA